MTTQDRISPHLTELYEPAGTVIYMGNIDFSDSSAAAHRVINNKKIFEALGYRVVLLGVTKENRFEGLRCSACDPQTFEKSYPNSTPSWIKHTFDTENIRILAKQFIDLELIITYNIPFSTFRAIQRAFRNTRVKLAYDCTEWSNYTEGSFIKRSYKKFDLWKLIRLLPKTCRNVIAVSSLIASQYQQCNTLRLPPLVDTNNAIWHQTAEKHPDIFEFCYSAATFENKDSPVNLIRAFSKLKNPKVRLTVIGLDENGALGTYPAITDTVKNDDRISFSGRLTHEKTIRRLLSADCFVFFRESNLRNNAGFPTKFVEAYTCSALIATNPTGDLKDYADGDSVIMIEDTSVESIKELLEKISANGPQAARNINTTFDYHRYIDRTKEWISRLY